MTGEPKRHHILPISYLEQFSYSKKFVPCFQKRDARFFRTTAKNVAVQSNLNTFRFSDGRIDRTTMEEFYGIIESDLPNMLCRVCDPPVPPDVDGFFKQFAIRQKMRTPPARDLLGETMKTFAETGLMDSFGHTLDAEEVELLKAALNGSTEACEQIGLRISGHYGMAIAEQIEQMGVVYLPVFGSKSLITCDDPVLIFGLDGKRVTAPIPSTRKVMIFPLSPRVVMFGDSDLRTKDGIILYRKDAKILPAIAR